MALPKTRPVVSLGELVAAAYDEADALTSDSELASHLAAEAIKDLLIRTGNERVARRLMSQGGKIERIGDRKRGIHCRSAA